MLAKFSMAPVPALKVVKPVLLSVDQKTTILGVEMGFAVAPQGKKILTYFYGSGSNN